TIRSASERPFGGRRAFGHNSEPTEAQTLSPTEAQSFERWKMCLTIAPVLLNFDSRRRSVLTTDASEVAISAVLTQPNDDGVHHPVAYESRIRTLTEQAYPAHVLELLAV
ncbi:MAG: ribonuclease H family protein, partial [bacterium]